MIGITITGKAYIAIAATLPVGSGPGPDIAPDGVYLVWLPRDVVNHLRALRAPDETFSDVILRLAASGSVPPLTR